MNARVMIKLNNVNKIYTNNTGSFHALRHINLTIHQGDIFGILGKSGAGKSTLLRCINLLEKPTSGSVFVNDCDLLNLNSLELRTHRRKIGMIFQHFNLLESRTVFANVALPLEILHLGKTQIDKRVKELLEIVGLSERAHYYPKALSGGQKQRVAIARALASNPHVLLCDEATSALDAESTHSILKLLKQINRDLNLTIVLITHELNVIKQICDRAGVIHHGELIEEDLALNLIANPKTTVTKQLVQQALHFYEPEYHKPNTTIIKLTFIGKDSDEPLISTLVKKFDITVNLLQALIEKIQETTVGFTICELTGDKTEINRALEYINHTAIKVEVISHA